MNDTQPGAAPQTEAPNPWADVTSHRAQIEHTNRLGTMVDVLTEERDAARAEAEALRQENERLRLFSDACAEANDELLEAGIEHDDFNVMVVRLIEEREAALARVAVLEAGRLRDEPDEAEALREALSAAAARVDTLTAFLSRPDVGFCLRGNAEWETNEALRGLAYEVRGT